ncbi:PRC-barrel domain-containing protein [Kineosporia sp. J2-2]|uniref:PRC-barrel domain-containing protein n=1 Tax=Kineosporia corallincola TaxID=2835133 RepID=A0ABS5TSW7_9ACTN|nr:PRC-barrel domain-containing protein [Kineosporia corallincola]MBT0773873.1 PRC-barrel domain-containing protein [Kineosporia corallincola]
MNLKPQEARDLVGRPVHDSHGERLGAVSGVYFNDVGRDLAWVSFVTDPESSDAESARNGQAFVPAGQLQTHQDRLTLPFDRGVLENQPHIEPHDGSLSNAQVARLHEFFHTFDGHSRITGASEGEPPTARVVESTEKSRVPFTGRGHEAAFGTGAALPGEPHDVTLQGNGNSAP